MDELVLESREQTAKLDEVLDTYDFNQMVDPSSEGGLFYNIPPRPIPTSYEQLAIETLSSGHLYICDKEGYDKRASFTQKRSPAYFNYYLDGARTSMRGFTVAINRDDFINKETGEDYTDLIPSTYVHEIYEVFSRVSGESFDEDTAHQKALFVQFEYAHKKGLLPKLYTYLKMYAENDAKQSLAELGPNAEDEDRNAINANKNRIFTELSETYNHFLPLGVRREEKK